MPDRYRDELREIAQGVRPALKPAKIKDPASHGWLRRPEYDTPEMQAWERPDGTLVGLRATRARRRPRASGTA